MPSLLASRLKQRRKKLGLSQKEVAEGICKQAQISRLESGGYMPGAELIFKLSRKLRVPMEYFFDEKIDFEVSDLKEFKKICKDLLAKRDYISLQYLYHTEIGKSHRLSLNDKHYLDWIGLLVAFYCENRQAEATEILEKQLSNSKKIDLHYMCMVNTLFNFYSEQQNLERMAEIKQGLVNRLGELKLNTLEEQDLFIKLNYNIGRYLWQIKDIEGAIRHITETIEYCNAHHTNYCLADLYCMLGNLTEEFAEKHVVKDYFETAYFLYKLEKNDKMILSLQHYLKSAFD